MENPNDEVLVAAGDGDLETVQRLLPAKGLEYADANGYTCLHSSSAYKRLDVVSWLLQSGANVNVADGEGDIPLHYADSLEVARILLANGADPSIRNAEGKTALESKLDDVVAEDDGDYDAEDEEQVRYEQKHTQMGIVLTPSSTNLIPTPQNDLKAMIAYLQSQAQNEDSVMN